MQYKYYNLGISTYTDLGVRSVFFVDLTTVLTWNLIRFHPTQNIQKHKIYQPHTLDIFNGLVLKYEVEMNSKKKEKGQCLALSIRDKKLW